MNMANMSCSRSAERSRSRTSSSKSPIARKASLTLSSSVQTIRSIDENLQTLSLSTKYKSPQIPSARPQLPIGLHSQRALSTRNKQTVPKWAKVSPTQAPLTPEDKQRLHRRKSAQVYQSWSDSKSERVAAETQRLRQDRRKKLEENRVLEQQKLEKSNEAFLNWSLKKQDKHHTPSKKNTKTSHFKGSPHIDEFIAVLRRFQSPCVPEYEMLLPMLDRRNKVSATKVQSLIAQVEVELRIGDQLAALEAEEEQHGVCAEESADVSPTERLRRQVESLQQRIGEAILKRVAPTRADFVKFMSNVGETMGTKEQKGFGRVSKKDFHASLKELGLGISSVQQIDLIKAIEDARFPNEIEWSRFGTFLINALAKKAYVQGSPALETTLDIAMSLCEQSSAHETSLNFEEMMVEAENHRARVNLGQVGWIRIRDLRDQMSAMDDGLPLSKRKDFHGAIIKFCKSIDVDHDGVIEIIRIEQFLRKIELDLDSKNEMKQTPATDLRKQELRNRLLNILISKFTEDKIAFSKMINIISSCFGTNNDDAPVEGVSAASFIVMMRNVKCGLSMVQIEQLAKVCDSPYQQHHQPHQRQQQQRQQGVNKHQFLDWIKEAKQNADMKKRRRDDPRSAIVDDIFRTVGTNPDVVLRVLDGYFDILAVYDERDSIASPKRYNNNTTNNNSSRHDINITTTNTNTVTTSNSVRNMQEHVGPSLSEEHIPESDFDLSWGRDAHGVLMTPTMKDDEMPQRYTLSPTISIDSKPHKLASSIKISSQTWGVMSSPKIV